MRKLLIILGSTATGKTDLALKIAKEFNGEIVSADSRQVYKGLDIGTGKITSKVESLIKKKRQWIVNGIVIHLYDVLDAKNQYNVALFVKDAKEIIDDIFKRGKLPIVVGGTGLYIKALLYGVPVLSASVDFELRKQLEGLSKVRLQEKLQRLDNKKWQSLNASDKQNPRRLVRAIELVGIKQSKPPVSEFDTLKIGLTANKNILYKRVDFQIKARLDQGMIDEAKKLHQEGLSLKRMRQLGLEYGMLADHLEGSILSNNDLILKLQQKIHNYVRRQLTWFKKEKNVFWFDSTESNLASKVEKYLEKWYHPSNAA